MVVATPCYSATQCRPADRATARRGRRDRCGHGASMRGHLRLRGDVWELRAYAGRDPVSGRKLYRTRSFRGGKREAEDALAKFVQEVTGDHTSRDATVGDLVARWFELAKADLSPL